MAKGKRKEYFIKQGYSSNLINILESCGVDKHMLWFLNQLRHNGDGKNIDDKTKRDINMINKHIESKSKNNFNNMEEAYKSAYIENARKNLSIKKALYTFKDGHSIILLNTEDLILEGTNMSNCVGGYRDKIKSKNVALFALKNPEGDTLVHFEIMKNGMLSQNFEKANMPVRHIYWKYIYEFFKNNSKNIQSSKHLGFAWRSSMRQNQVGCGFEISVECVMPKKISKRIDNGGELITHIESSNIIKKFNAQFPSIYLTEFDKSNFIKKMKSAKSDIIKAFDDMIANVDITCGENLYVSDKIKEIAFGDGCYTMKGEEYNANDIFTSFIMQEDMPIAMPDEAMVAPEAEFPMEIRPAPRMGRPVQNEEIPVPQIRFEEADYEEMPQEEDGRVRERNGVNGRQQLMGIQDMGDIMNAK